MPYILEYWCGRMIIEICYDSKHGLLATGEPCERAKGSSEDLVELSFEQSNSGSISFSRCGDMYVIPVVRDYSPGGFTLIVYVADNEHEATKAFVEELERRLDEFGDRMTRKELEETLKALEKYKDYSKNFSEMKQMAERLISGKPLPPSPPPAISITFEKTKEKLKKDLSLPQDVLNRTRELIDAYQPYVDKKVKDLIEHFKDLIEIGELHIPPTLEPQLPRLMRTDIVIGACLYLACKEKGLSVSQFQIAKAQGHYDDHTLGEAVRDIRVKLQTKNS